MGKAFIAVGVAAVVAVLNVPTPASAADVEPVPVPDEWTFTVAPYVWGAGLSGDVGLFGREPVNVDMSFSDIFKDLKFAAMGVTEAHNGTWGVFSDLMYVHTKADESIQRLVGGIPTALDASVDTESFAATLMGEYRAVDSDQMTLDLMAGLRVWNVDNYIAASLAAGGTQVAAFSGSDGDTWVDPMIGVKTRVDTGTPLFITAWGMIGGAGVGSDITWDAMGGVGYQWTEGFSTVLGYRALGVDYKNSGFVYDVIQQGIVLGGVFRF